MTTARKKTTLPTVRQAAIWLAAFVLCTCNLEPEPRAEKAKEKAQRPAAALGDSLFAAAPDKRWKLPNRLREISGLATTRDGRLFGHGDEAGVVYELDMSGDGRIVKNFALGEPIVRDDFEGLAITPAGDFYLTTSTGRIYRFREGSDGAHVAFATFETGLRRVCEVEGLMHLAQDDSLILACKANYSADMRNAIALYQWTPPQGARARAASLFLRVEDAEAFGGRRINPSGVELDARSGRILVIAARDRALIELDRSGAVAAARLLDESHVQAEGIAIMPDGALVIADEAAGGRALLTRYPRR
jgi:uncharacterized protein YjiK